MTLIACDREGGGAPTLDAASLAAWHAGTLASLGHALTEQAFALLRDDTPVKP